MSRYQLVFAELFSGQVYEPRDGFEAREWQVEAITAYRDSIRSREGATAQNGQSAQHRWCLYAGPGSGKTLAAALHAALLLNLKLISMIVFVCPNRSIRRKTQKDFRRFFGIDLPVFHARKHSDGVPRMKQGYILTYAHLMQDPTLHRRICSPETLVIFDEVHHLGDSNGWGTSAVEAFDKVHFVLALTGTPYRSDNTRIPLVSYHSLDANGLLRFKSDPESDTGYTYSFGRAVVEGICRKPAWSFHDGEVTVRDSPDAEPRTLSFDKKVSDADAAHRLRGAVKYGSLPRRNMLRVGLRVCREENRKVIIFLGGDTEGEHTPTMDATELLPSELAELGIGPEEFVVVTGDDNDAQSKIERFGPSAAWILVSINMVSEGVDIPELSAAIFLTSITAKQTTAQRIGRSSRLGGEDDPHKTSLNFMFKDPDFVTLADEIESEIAREITIRRKRDRAEGTGSNAPSRVEAIGVAGGEMVMVKFHGQEWPAAVFQAALDQVRQSGLPSTMINGILILMTRRSDGHG
jgi:superfamily II DNA or RNA helicase